MNIAYLVNSAVALDLARLINNPNMDKIDKLRVVGASALWTEMSATYYTVSVFVYLLGLMNDTSNSCCGLGPESSVFVYQGERRTFCCAPMSICDGITALTKLFSKNLDNVPLIFLDEVPPPDTELFIYYAFLRNLIRCLGLTCLLAGTESALVNMVETTGV